MLICWHAQPNRWHEAAAGPVVKKATFCSTLNTYLVVSTAVRVVSVHLCTCLCPASRSYTSQPARHWHWQSAKSSSTKQNTLLARIATPVLTHQNLLPSDTNKGTPGPKPQQQLHTASPTQTGCCYCYASSQLPAATVTAAARQPAWPWPVLPQHSTSAVLRPSLRPLC